MSASSLPATRRIAVAFAFIICSSCAKSEEQPAAEAPPARDPNTPLYTAARGMKTPESVLWDERNKVWYVSNINGNPPQKDDNGFIVRLGSNGEVMDTVPFINGADDDITLHAPKGMALKGDTLWVADIDAVRAFDINTGNQVGSVDLRGLRATFLNDVAIGNDGGIYITDTGIAFGADGSVTHPGKSRVFVVHNMAATEAVVLPKESGANGISWNSSRNAWVIVGFNAKDIYEWVPGAKEATVLGQGIGGADGLLTLPGNRAIYSSWVDSSLNVFEGGASRTLRKGIPSPADLGYDPERRLIAVPVFTLDRVEFWPLDEMPAASAAAPTPAKSTP